MDVSIAAKGVLLTSVPKKCRLTELIGEKRSGWEEEFWDVDSDEVCEQSLRDLLLVNIFYVSLWSIDTKSIELCR